MTNDAKAAAETTAKEVGAFHASSLYSDHERRILLGVLCLISVVAYLDRTILTVLLEPIKVEFDLSDGQLGLLTGSFALFYATLGLPIARWADRGDRRTIIVLALVLWSVMTVICGFVTSFALLLFARVLVGGGESGAQPTGQSLIADYFPEVQRGRALAIFAASASLGNFAGLMLGSLVVVTMGWRWAFIFAGLPGIILALVAWLMLKEPRADPRYQLPKEASEGAWLALKRLFAKPSYRLMIVAIILYFCVGIGAVSFIPTYLVRVLEIDMATMGLSYGLASGAATLIGSVAGGVLVDKLRKINPRWVLWFPAIGLVLSSAFWIAMFLVQGLIAFLVVSFFLTFLLLAVSPAIFTALHAVCGSPRRTVAVAFAFFAGYLIGMGVGPTMVGVLSDYFSQENGVLGLRYAMIAAGFLFIPAGLVLYLASNTLVQDIEP